MILVGFSLEKDMHTPQVVGCAGLDFQGLASNKKGTRPHVAPSYIPFKNAGVHTNTILSVAGSSQTGLL
jgi:hypothetical protein